MAILEDKWKQFRVAKLLEDTTPENLRIMKLCFYCGAISIMTSVTQENHDQIRAEVGDFLKTELINRADLENVQ